MANHNFSQVGGGHGVASGFGGGVWWEEQCENCGMTRRGRRRSGAQRSVYNYEPDAYGETPMANPLAYPEPYLYSCDAFRARSRSRCLQAP